ncbi:PIN domain protein [Litoribacter ruber]|uniref:PIN domain protein n=1 Tax=Litoribacter ruber TaxID=702568 RepID=A0AAP2CN75_9BACT|nr:MULTISPECIES: PIN domain-containing protein [Litoribacter]MBS9524847.1 PIN domain protein [Litoribacter alkaliphilus]MBT0812570.1 PIN domain protein [Litoribacter ruber]
MRGVVFDTSIWIEYFKANPNYFPVCQTLLEQGSVYAMDIIFAELQQGARGRRELSIIEGYFESLPRLHNGGIIYEAGVFSQQEKLISKGVGLIDSIIIYGVMKHQLQLWTLDKKIISFLDSDYLYSP